MVSVAEVPAMEVPAAEVPAEQVLDAEVPDAEVQAAEVPAAEVPVTEGPAAESLAAEGPTADGSAADGSVAGGPTPEGPDAHKTLSETESVSDKKTGRMKSSANFTFHIPALVGGPHANRSNLRQRPVLVRNRTLPRKRFALKVYASLWCQICLAGVFSGVVGLAVRGMLFLPGRAVFPIPSVPVEWAGYPFNTLPILLPAWCCQIFFWVSLSCWRSIPYLRRPFLIGATISAGLNLGLLTYLDNDAFGCLLVLIIWMALIVHVVGISLNFVSWCSKMMMPVKPTASKMEVMVCGSHLTGREKLICMLNDEEAVETRATFVMACISWVVASLAVSIIFGYVLGIHAISLAFAGILACPAIMYFVYGVEKQLRRCNEHECEKAVVNVNIDLLFAWAYCVTLDLSFMSWEAWGWKELGTAKPFPVKNSSFRSVMMQMSRTTSQTSQSDAAALGGPAHPVSV